MTPILKSDCMELGTGNMDLKGLWQTALGNGTEGVVLESHRNWIEKSPIRRQKKSGEWLKSALSGLQDCR